MSAADTPQILADIEDEYDPAVPNVYDEIIRQNEKQLMRHTDSDMPDQNESLEDHFASGDVQGPSPSAMALLMKMGWKAGKGLGKNQQGITAPLMVTQTSQGSGIIEQGKDLEIRPKARPRGQPTSSLCLLNVIDVNDIDDDLEGEIADEASRFGNLIDVRLEKDPQHWDPAEQVKIICEYETIEDATKALVHFNGRFFGGRVVEAVFLQG